jgi:hypothetical protein
MREYPEGIRSAVLDSGVPLQVDHEAEGPDLRAEALEALFAGCEADPAWQAAYPELEAVFYELVERFAAEPIRVAAQDEAGDEIQAWFTDENLIDGAYDSLYDQSLIPVLPLVAYQIGTKSHLANRVQAAQWAVREGLASVDVEYREGMWHD